MHQYEILKERIKKQIFSGEFTPGELLPSEQFLSNENSLNRHTVRRALEELHREGYIRRQKGRRSEVIQRHPRLGLLSFKGFSEVLAYNDKKIRSAYIQEPEIIEWPETFFFSLSEEEKKQPAVFLERIRYLEENPVMLEKTWFSAGNKKSILEKPFERGSLFTTLQVSYNIEIKDVIQDIRAIKGDKRTCNHLQINSQEPVLYLSRKYVTNMPDFYVYSQLYVNTHEYSISNDNY